MTTEPQSTTEPVTLDEALKVLRLVQYEVLSSHAEMHTRYCESGVIDARKAVDDILERAARAPAPTVAPEVDEVQVTPPMVIEALRMMVELWDANNPDDPCGCVGASDDCKYPPPCELCCARKALRSVAKIGADQRDARLNDSEVSELMEMLASANPIFRQRVHDAVSPATPRSKAGSVAGTVDDSFQGRVQPWMAACFGAEISSDKEERNHRFLEEALELVQACGMTQGEAVQLIDYVFNRPADPPEREVGGVMLTLAALCLAQGFNMQECAEAELTRVWGKIDIIRAKQAAKPKHSPLPQP